MNLLQDKIDIVTEYGKLTVPPRDIRSIEFGIHATDEERKKLDEAIVNLASTSHKDRDVAVQDLIDMGPLAYLRLFGVFGPGEAPTDCFPAWLASCVEGCGFL